LKILLAEDNEVNQVVAVQMLRKRGHAVVVASNGQEALQALETQSFDVVLMDVQMPEMDGLAATAVIRENEKGTRMHIPIVALTAHAMKGDRERCLAMGMDAYIAKPLRASELFETLAGLLPSAVGTGIASPAAEPAKSPPTMPAPSNGQPVFDLGLAMQRAEGDMELLLAMRQLFANQAEEALAEIRSGVKQREGPALERAAHKLKGSVGNFGAQRALDAALRLEIIGRQGEWSDGERAFAELEKEVRDLQEALAQIEEGAAGSFLD
jgi:CheY-like chemotaxis protein